GRLNPTRGFIRRRLNFLEMHNSRKLARRRTLRSSRWTLWSRFLWKPPICGRGRKINPRVLTGGASDTPYESLRSKNCLKGTADVGYQMLSRPWSRRGDVRDCG